jgi:hypothetical protein
VNTKSTFVLAFLVSACGGAMPPSTPASSSDVGATPPGAMAEAKMEPAPTQPTATNAKSTSAGATKTEAQAPEFLIMYDGEVTMGVDDGKIADTIDRIIDVSESVGGHLAGRKDLGVSIRIPSARFREPLGKIGALGDVLHESVTAEDVSEEYHDAEVRLANLKATRQRLQDFLAKSMSMSDMLTLERELERVSMDIDRIEGRMRFLREHVAYSTLTVALVARAKSQPVVAGGKVTVAPRVMRLRAEWLDDLGVPKLIGSN